MAVNKVIFGGETVVDLTTDTVTAEKMLSGTTAHDKSGAKVTGTIATKTASNMTVSGATVTAPAGYYASAQSKSVATATQATPSISVSSGGLITASATQSAGYVSSGTKSATKQLTVQAAQTITPGTSDKTIASGRYLTGTQTIKGDANLVPENIASGVSIFGVTGTMEAGGGDGGGGGAPDTVFAVLVPEDIPKIELIGYRTGMTWYEFYDSYSNGVVVSPDLSRMLCKIEDSNGYPGISYVLDGGWLNVWSLAYEDGSYVQWEDTIQPFDLDTLTPIYTPNGYSPY